MSMEVSTGKVFSPYLSAIFRFSLLQLKAQNSFKNETKFMMQLWSEGQAVTSVVCIPNVY